jgi:thioredoxin-like negative regulator of GroEL
VFKVAEPSVTIYTASWCLPWRVVEKQLGEALSRIVLVNVDEDPDAADQARVAVLPTVVARFKSGAETRRTGAVSVQEVLGLLERVHED